MCCEKKFWIYNNFISPAALINNQLGNNNFTLIAAKSKDQWRVWVKALEPTGNGEDLFWAYGRESDHNEKIAAAQHKIAEQAEKAKTIKKKSK